MTISFSLGNIIHLLALILGVASLVAPRFLNVYVAIFLIVYAIIGFGILR